MSSVKREAFANRRAGVREAHTLINNSRDLAQARLIVEGLLARIDAEYKACQEPRDCAWNRADPETLIGQRIEATAAFSGIPKGTTGRVIRADHGDEREDCTVTIEWDLPCRKVRLTYCFSRDEWERWIKVI